MTTPRVSVSGLFIKPGRVGGAEFMTYAIVEGLLEIGHPVDLFISAAEPLEDAFAYRTRSHAQSGQLRMTPVKIRGNRFVTEAIALPALTRRTGARDLLLPNYFTPPFHAGLRTLSAILDLQYLHFPQFFSPQKRLWLRAAHELTLRRATRVSVISDFVRDDLLSRYGRRFERLVRTIPIGISWDRFGMPDRPDVLGSRSAPFVLSVASHYSHKNLATLLRAFARIARHIPHDLLLVGQRRANLVGVRHGGAVDLETLAIELGIADRVVLTGHATDAVVGWCYRNAAVFVFPSLFEGFGMPAVEALGLGLPVITTRCGSLPEVTRGLAHLVSRPQDPDELAEAILTALRVPEEMRPSPMEVAALRAHYAPARIARMYLDALDETTD